MARTLPHNLVLPLQRQNKVPSATLTASNRTMDCEEYQQLEHAYAEAARRWSQYASPQTMVLPGKDQLHRATLRQEALVERNSAANTLHLHRHQCKVCKRRGAA
jgi:hypothetical protein